MKLASYRYRNEDSFGIINDSGVIDLSGRLGAGVRNLKDLIRLGCLEQAREIAKHSTSDFGLDDVSFLPTITSPEKIVCIGVNYVNRNEEYKDDALTNTFPSVFMRTRESLVGHGEPLIRPPESEQLDYEGEIAIIIGKEGRRIDEMYAHEYIAGFSIMNEGTIRDWLRHAKFNVTQGKNFEGSGAFGPWMVTVDEFSSYDGLWVTTRVNKEVRQHDTSANLLFSFRYLIHYLSTFMRLKPGDVISTGTPTGAGARLDPPKYLKPGDVVEVEVSGIGTLINSVADE